MSDNNHEHTNPEPQELRRRQTRGHRGSENAELDRVLDAALARYAAVEPRPGLEERVLAHLRTAPEARGWMAGKLWAVAGFAVAAIVVVIALTMTWRMARLSHPTIANQPSHSSAPAQAQRQPKTQVATNPSSDQHSHASHPARKLTSLRADVQPVAIAVEKLPRLDQFPSPEPLNEQEKLLADYVEQNPERAVFLAEAHMSALRQEAEEHRRLAAEDSQQ